LITPNRFNEQQNINENSLQTAIQTMLTGEDDAHFELRVGYGPNADDDSNWSDKGFIDLAILYSKSDKSAVDIIVELKLVNFKYIEAVPTGDSVAPYNFKDKTRKFTTQNIISWLVAIDKLSTQDILKIKLTKPYTQRTIGEVVGEAEKQVANYRRRLLEEGVIGSRCNTYVLLAVGNRFLYCKVPLR
jgi:hypothetical protein